MLMNINCHCSNPPPAKASHTHCIVPLVIYTGTTPLASQGGLPSHFLRCPLKIMVAVANVHGAPRAGCYGGAVLYSSLGRSLQSLGRYGATGACYKLRCALKITVAPRQKKEEFSPCTPVSKMLQIALFLRFLKQEKALKSLSLHQFSAFFHLRPAGAVFCVC